MSLATDYSISAAAARKSTEENIRSSCEAEIKLIRSKINNAVSQCEFYVSGSCTLKIGTQEWLKSKGYEVRIDTQYNESYWTISRKNAN